ncbi:uncharacterized protein LOC121399381 isoform X2 [Xenopus laevis]|uniref:Hemogen n=2 Tax=Xenopus laevis TaxID=8355 RepID=A0A974I186_XENLA|nr:uncharacterized protein LOC121399381 isoform X2 [Xenopus laevis]OCT97743.1 hypothetical protein XELAEV_18009972mg [Xenopus laevis]
MDDFKKDHHYSDVAEVSTVQHHEAQQDMPEITTRRLRDRTLLKRKREEALEKDSFQGQTSSKGQRKGTTGRGRKKVQKTEPEPDVQCELTPEAEPQTAPEVLQEKTDIGLEHLHYHEDPGLTVTKEGNNNKTFLTHEDQAAGHVSHSSIPFLTENKEPEPEEEASPVSLASIPLPETLSFSQEHQCEEQNIYTHLL